jgi:hypothetical protein
MRIAQCLVGKGNLSEFKLPFNRENQTSTEDDPVMRKVRTEMCKHAWMQGRSQPLTIIHPDGRKEIVE